jgi:hypothetical protein
LRRFVVASPYLQPFILLRADANKYLTRNLKAVRPFKPSKLLFNFDPRSLTLSLGQSVHEFPAEFCMLRIASAADGKTIPVVREFEDVLKEAERS